ncbi:MAG: hypothetical protein JSS82_13580 [Bacteroidetes bacterium]|nr:hypothetical protein [Bacteroidota bacterium]
MQQYRPGIILFLIFLIAALLCYKDYGISFDEPEQRKIGTVSFNYVVRNDDSLMRFGNRVYGVGYELPLIAMEKVLHLQTTRSIYLARHIVTHILFLFSALCMYVLSYRLFRSRFLGCAAFLLLVLFPRLYAHSFFNTKDIPFLAMAVILFTAAQYVFEKNRSALYILLGMLCGYCVSIRILGLMYFYIFASFLIIDLVAALVGKQKPLKALVNLLLFTGAAVATVYIAWPFIWHDPIASLRYSYDTFSQNAYAGVFFKGAYVEPGHLPQSYLPFWIAVTVPVLLLPAAFASIILIIVAFFKRPLNFILNRPERNFSLYIACFSLPVLFVVFYNYNIYDDWRHMYFVYPCLVLLSIYTFHMLAQTRLKTPAYGILAVQCCLLLWFIIRNHPFEQVYFNELISHKDEYLRKNFDFDYWGASTKQGYDYILSHDTRPLIKVSYSHEPLYNNYLMLTEEQKKRIQLMENSDDYDYYMTNFRCHPDDFNFPNTVYNVKVLNSTVLRVYKAR